MMVSYLREILNVVEREVHIPGFRKGKLRFEKTRNDELDHWNFKKPPVKHTVVKTGGVQVFEINGKRIKSFSRKKAEEKYQRLYGTRR